MGEVVEGRTRYGQLLADGELKRWYDNVRRGSPIAAVVREEAGEAQCLTPLS